ncbi:MAG: rRNA pseudouridine synthase [Lachnospiraceae bacterium]|nr:rRNA pseudouridine synthase [Lachnospiraceae bacterium]
MKPSRLDKFLADAGIGTRSEVKIYLKKRMVQVNGSICTKPEQKVDPDTDEVLFQGNPIAAQGICYYMLHKPAGVVSATEDNRDRTVIDLLKAEGINTKDLFPVGRLDKDTEGLLLITNDGALAHNLLSPKKHVDKTYYARIEGVVTEEDIQKFAEGLDIGEDKPTLPGKLVILQSDTISEIELTIQEGKFHQVKRMFQAVGKEVIYLKRLSMGTLTLDPALPVGAVRPLTEEELSSLKK